VRLFLDGKPILERDLFRRILPRVQWIDAAASDGPHQLLVKAAVGEAGHSLRVEALPRSGGRAPRSLPELARVMEGEYGAALGRSLAALAAAEDDPHGALALLEEATALEPVPGALKLEVRSALWGPLDTLTEDDARGRSQRDLDAWIALDPRSPEARLRRSQIFAELNRLPLAQQDLDQLAQPPPAVLVAKARVQMQRDAVPLALPTLRQVLAGDPDNCSALELLETAEDQANAFEMTEEVSRRQAACPGGTQSRAQFLARAQGPKPLVDYWRGRLERSPGDPEAALQLSEALLAAGDSRGALEAIDVRLRSWPGDGAALRRQA